MDKTLIEEECNQLFFAEVPDTFTRPDREFWYHYTSFEIFKLILDGKQLKLNRHKNLIDEQEIEFGIQILNTLANQYSSSNLPQWLKNVINCFGVWLNNWCYYTASGSLSMNSEVLFEKYPGRDKPEYSGIAIGFNINNMLKRSQNVVPTIGKVQYGERAYNDTLNKAFSRYIQLYEKFIYERRINSYFESLNLCLISCLFMYLPLIKESKWSIENECRLYLPPSFARRMITLNEDCIYFPINLQAISQVVLGPNFRGVDQLKFLREQHNLSFNIISFKTSMS